MEPLVFIRKGLATSGSLLAVAGMLFQSAVLAQTAIPAPKLAPNLARETAGTSVVGHKPPPSGTGTAGAVNYVRTHTPRVAITSEEDLLRRPERKATVTASTRPTWA
jgi:hypothetical protein